jgi:hypothetical protein
MPQRPSDRGSASGRVKTAGKVLWQSAGMTPPPDLSSRGVSSPSEPAGHAASQPPGPFGIVAGHPRLANAAMPDDAPHDEPRIDPVPRLAPWRWVPGQSGNPKGAPSRVNTLASRAREATRNGEELIEFMVNVMRGEPMSRKGRVPQLPRPEMRLTAAEWLADRGWGKAREIVELMPDKPRDRVAAFMRLSEEDRAQLRAILTRAFAEPESPALSPSPSEPTPPEA